MTYQLPAVALLVIGGVIAWAAGYRLFRFVLTLFGFYIGALAATAVLGPSDRTMLILAGVGGGVVGALVMFFGYFVGVALVGAGGGALTVHLISTRLGNEPHPFVLILAIVAGAAAAMVLQRLVIILATAFAGGWTMLWGATHVMNTGGVMPRRPQVWMVYPFDLSPERWWMLVVWLAVGMTGVFIQMRVTGRMKAPVRAAVKKRTT